MIALEPGAQFSTYMPTRWPHLNADTVMDRLHELRQNPNLIDQGALGLCGEAAFFHHVLQLDPVGFFAAAQTLFMQGLCVLGGLVIRPDFDLRMANYPIINATHQAAQAQDPTLPPMPPQADWMVLSALRDTENEALDFEGTPGENMAEGSNFEELYQWHLKSGLYTSVTKDEDADLAHVKANVVKTANNHIALRIRTAMLQPSTGKHIISLATPFVIDEQSDSVYFDYWSWGQLPAGVVLTVAQFTNTYLGAIIAEF